MVSLQLEDHWNCSLRDCFFTVLTFILQLDLIMLKAMDLKINLAILKCMSLKLARFILFRVFNFVYLKDNCYIILAETFDIELSIAPCY